jgi:hypothetical protein
MKRSSHYNSNDFQDSNKRKITKCKHWVISFNAFELGAENCESSIFERCIKINYRSIFNKEMNFVQMSC